MDYLNTQQIEKFRKDGFLVIKNVFTKKECDELKQTLMQEITKGKLALKNTVNNLKDKIDYNKIGDVPRKINEGLLQDIAHRNSKFMSVVKDKRIVNIIGKLFGDEIKEYCLYRSTSIFKNSKISSATAWHQDIIYWKGQPNKITVWFPLDQTEPQGGSMQYIPGTHTKLYEDILKNGHDTKSIEEYWKSPNQHKADENRKVTTKLEKGDIVIHHCCTMHGTEENILGKERYALIFTYQPSTDTSHHRSGKPEIIKK